MRMKLISRQHGTSTHVLVPEGGGRVSARTTRRVMRALCPTGDSCACGGGCGPQFGGRVVPVYDETGRLIYGYVMPV
jgi:hypothetical protein